MNDSQAKVPVLLMVSGGSDSTALLELVCGYARGNLVQDDLSRMIAAQLPDPGKIAPYVLHVNHLLRAAASDADERFVVELCKKLGVPCEVQRVDINALASEGKGGMEAVARDERYRLARAALERACVASQASEGIICTAHTLDDRIETFFMRALVGTGPGGLASIPRMRGNLRRPLLDASREQLRDWLRRRHPGMEDELLWREDETNLTGANFRSQVRRDLMPVLRKLRPGFEQPLMQTMDLMTDEDEALRQDADSIVYRTLEWDGEVARLPVNMLQMHPRPMQRRIVRACLLVVYPDARLRADQIDRILDHLDETGFATEASGGLRVRVQDDVLSIYKAQ